MATLREVANRAGVSAGTVSHVLNGTATVSPALKKRVLDAIAALNYQPDHIARSLKTGRTHTIGIIIPDITNPFFPQMVRGAEGVLWPAGYSLITCNTDDQPEREQHALTLLRSRRVDGVLLVVAQHCGDVSHIRALLDDGIPVVCLDRLPRDLARVDSVTVDNAAAAADCVRHLISMGHRRIAMMAGTLSLANARDRVKGYKSALREAHIPILDHLVREGDFRAGSGFRLCKELLSDRRRRPTALFVSNALMALGALQALSELGVRCPNDVALAAFDGFAYPEVFHPGITAVVQPTYEIGRLGAELLIQRLTGAAPEGAVHHVLSAELRVRESSLVRFHTSAK